jgi:hypothetical protein
VNDLQRVRARPGIVERHIGSVAAVILVALAAAIVKPWGTGAGPRLALAPSPTAPATAGPSRALSHAADRGFSDLVYDPAIFGSREPPPTWDLRPAALLVTFGFVFDVTETHQASPTPTESVTPNPDGGPSWPARVEVPRGYHVFLFGIDMPRGYRLQTATLVRLWLSGPEGPRFVTTRRLASPWPDHFAVLGMPSTVDPGRLVVWPDGEYRLDLAFEPGGIERSLEIVLGA